MTRLPANVSSTAWVTSLTDPDGPRGRSSPVNRVTTSTGRPPIADNASAMTRRFSGSLICSRWKRPLVPIVTVFASASTGLQSRRTPASPLFTRATASIATGHSAIQPSRVERSRLPIASTTVSPGSGGASGAVSLIGGDASGAASAIAGTPLPAPCSGAGVTVVTEGTITSARAGPLVGTATQGPTGVPACVVAAPRSSAATRSVSAAIPGTLAVGSRWTQRAEQADLDEQARVHGLAQVHLRLGHEFEQPQPQARRRDRSEVGDQRDLVRTDRCTLGIPERDELRRPARRATSRNSWRGSAPASNAAASRPQGPRRIGAGKRRHQRVQQWMDR